MAAAVCAGIVLSGAAPLGQGAAPLGQGAVATPAASTGTMARDVQTLSRAYVDREAASQTPDATDTPTATADTSTAPAVFYLLSAANVRATASTAGTVLTTLEAGARVTATGVAAGGWQPVAAGSKTGFIKSSLLTTTAPATTKKPVSTRGAAASSYPACASGSAVEAGLVANAILVHRAVCTTFPDITRYGGIRGDGSEHASGQALDIMTSGGRGQQIAAWLRANYSKLGVVEIIYQQQIWTTQRASEGWRPMPDRGSVTANHDDHIHVLVA
ncbi:MAG: SH3 domain-containing protein [Propionibacteriaceae bacterium]